MEVEATELYSDLKDLVEWVENLVKQKELFLYVFDWVGENALRAALALLIPDKVRDEVKWWLRGLERDRQNLVHDLTTGGRFSLLLRQEMQRRLIPLLDVSKQILETVGRGETVPPKLEREFVRAVRNALHLLVALERVIRRRYCLSFSRRYVRTLYAILITLQPPPPCPTELEQQLVEWRYAHNVQELRDIAYSIMREQGADVEVKKVEA